MKAVVSRLLSVIGCAFIFAAAWFCLWSISLHLVERADLAVLLFPFGLRLGLMLQCPRGYWPVLLGTEWLLILWLAQEVALAHPIILMTGSLLTLLPVALISRYRQQRDWLTLLRQGGALMAAALLQRDALDSPSQTNLAQTWAQEGRRFTLDDGEIRATIRDGHACFNLNAINHRADEAGDGTPYPTDVFVRLLALLGEPPLRASQIAAALGDWTDSDGQPRLNGAEDEVYMAQTPGYLAANQPMQDVSELRLLAGMDAALYQRLLPFVCVQPDDALQVNVNTLRPSQAALLVALFPGDLTLQEAQQLLHNRPRTGWSSVAAFLAQPTLQKTDTTLARPWLTVHSARFIAAFSVVTGNLRFQLHSVLQQSGRTFTVVQRRYGLSMVVDEQD